MNRLLKFAGGLVVGAALGAGAYIILTQDNEHDLVRSIKEEIFRALEEGKRAAEEQRRLLEAELGFAIADESSMTDNN